MMSVIYDWQTGVELHTQFNDVTAIYKYRVDVGATGHYHEPATIGFKIDNVDYAVSPSATFGEGPPPGV
jgi:hypothetical protein